MTDDEEEFDPGYSEHTRVEHIDVFETEWDI